MDVSENGGTPQIIHFTRLFQKKPSIVRYPKFWKHPYSYGNMSSFKQLYKSTATQRWRRQGAWEADAFAPTASAWRWLMAREDRGLHKGVGGWHWTYHWKMLFFWKWNSFSEWPSFKLFGFPYLVKNSLNFYFRVRNGWVRKRRCQYNLSLSFVPA